MKLKQLSLRRISHPQRWRRLRVKVERTRKIKIKTKIRITRIQEEKSTAQYQMPKLTKCVTGISDMEPELGTVLPLPPALGRTRRRTEPPEGPADLEEVTAKQTKLITTLCFRG